MTTTSRPLGSKHHALSALALAVSLASASAAHADALSDLKDQTETLQRKVTDLSGGAVR